MLDPHSAIGYLGLQTVNSNDNSHGIFLATAHPAKFKDVVAEETGTLPPFPDALITCMDKPKKTIPIKPDFEELRDFLLETKRSS